MCLVSGECVVCGSHVPAPVRAGGRRRVYCSDACRQKAYRQRRRSYVDALERGEPAPVPASRVGVASRSLRARQQDAQQRFRATVAAATAGGADSATGATEGRTGAQRAQEGTRVPTGACNACQERVREVEQLQRCVGVQQARIRQLEGFLDALRVPADADIDDVMWAREIIAHGMVIALKQAIEMGMQVRPGDPFFADVVALADMVKPTRQHGVGRGLFGSGQRKRKKKRKR